MEFGMFCRIKAKREICAHFNEGSLAQFERSVKNIIICGAT